MKGALALLGLALAASPAQAEKGNLPAEGFHEITVRLEKCADGKLSDPLSFHVVPGCRELVKGPLGEQWNEFNRLGLRDKNYGPKKKGVFRIVIAGDSNLATTLLPAEQSFPKQLEALFRAEGKAVEVINAGTDGYSGVQLALQAPKYLAEYRPDLFVFYPTNAKTFLADAIGERYLSFRPDGSPLAYYRNPLRRLPDWLHAFVMRDRSRIAYVVTWFEILDQRRISKRALKEGPAALMEPTLRLAAHMRKASEAAGSAFLLALDTTVVRNRQNSMRFLFDNAMRFAMRWLIPAVEVQGPAAQAEAGRSGLPWVPVKLTEGINAHLDPTGLHYDREGNAQIAAALKAALEEKVPALRGKARR